MRLRVRARNHARRDGLLRGGTARAPHGAGCRKWRAPDTARDACGHTRVVDMPHICRGKCIRHRVLKAKYSDALLLIKKNGIPPDILPIPLLRAPGAASDNERAGSPVPLVPTVRHLHAVRREQMPVLRLSAVSQGKVKPDRNEGQNRQGGGRHPAVAGRLRGMKATGRRADGPGMTGVTA